MEPISFATALATTIAYFIGIESTHLRNSDKRQFKQEQKIFYHQNTNYDFVVVGGGTAGCIVANRLSKKYTVLLLEAGGYPPPLTNVPVFFDTTYNYADINYQFKTLPQATLRNMSLYQSTGRMLGGSSSHNSLVYNRGNRRDYDNWADITEDPSWKYDAMLKFFKKAETYKGICSVRDQHGFLGPITIETSEGQIYSVWKHAAAELGYKVFDPNGPQKEGFAPTDCARENGRRVSTFDAYLKPILRSRRKLHVVKYAQVDRILFKGKTATGVLYTRHGKELKVRASKEVIVSAGSFGTPFLLFKSGIAPLGLLHKTKISPITYLPVGQNLQDHPGLELGPFTVDHPSYFSNLWSNLTTEEFEKYIKSDKEAILSGIQPKAQAFIVSSAAKERAEHDWPDLELFIIRLNYDPINPSSDIPTNEFYVGMFVGRPEYRKMNFGSVTLDTAAYLRGAKEIERLAKINYKFLQSKQDYSVLLDAIQTCLRILNTKAFQKIGTKLKPNRKCAKEHPFKSNEYWRCVVETTGRNWDHTSGTCRMGHGSSDKNAVVDSKLKIIGLARIRVVDASIIPQITNANIYAAVVALTEKASEDIIQDHEISFIRMSNMFGNRDNITKPFFVS